MRKPLHRSLAVLAVAATTGSLTTTVATPASAATTWLQVSAGYNHTCGVTSSHDLWCWGSNSFGQLGTGDTKQRLVPARVGAKGIWASVIAGSYHTCALDRDGTRYCWGNNEHGQLGYDDTKQRLKPTPADSTWTMISAGRDHTCGILTNRRAYCWGSDARGQLGNSDALNDGRPSVQRVKFDGRWSSISGRGVATCGVDSEGTRYCWGENLIVNYGSGLGLGKTNDSVVTTPATWGNGTWRSVEMGPYAGCGISQGKRLYCWGHNNSGKLGVGDTKDRFEPTQVSGSNWAQVSVGWTHSCGLKTDGTGYCWGSNTYGQLGTGSSPSSTATPTGVPASSSGKAPKTWSSLTTGANHTCGIRTDGILFCWGNNTYGQLGDNTTTKRTSPREVA